MINTVTSLAFSLVFPHFDPAIGRKNNKSVRQDPFAEEDFEGHAQLTAIVGDKARSNKNPMADGSNDLDHRLECLFLK